DCHVTGVQTCALPIWTFRILVLLVLFLFFHYVLPQHDVVRVTGTEVIRTDFTAWNRLFYAQADAGNVEGTTRDIRLINAVRPSEIGRASCRARAGNTR